MHMPSQRFRDFEDGETVPKMGYDVVIRRRHLGHLQMPTGSLVACDPIDALETEPFAADIEPGAYPVVMYAAELRDETLCAYTSLQVDDAQPIRWEVATVEDEELDPLDPDGNPGYPVESSLGSFMDARAAKVLMDYSHSLMPDDDDDYRRALRGRVHRRLESSDYAWANIDLACDAKVPQVDPGLNVIAFDSGYGPGIYTTYLGKDEDDNLTRVVTDFEVLEFSFNSFRFRC